MSHAIPQVKEYQTLFWVPMLFQTATAAENVIDEMLEMITTFHDNDQIPLTRPSFTNKGGQMNQRRQQILGDMSDAEIVTTMIDVVPKSENTKYIILSVLKVSRLLFSRQLHDYELDDVIDAMQSFCCSEGDIIINEGDSGDMFYVLEEGRHISTFPSTHVFLCPARVGAFDIFIGGQHLGRVEEQTSFGDLALMYNSPRAATIKAVTNCTLWTLDRIFFRQAMVTSSSNQNIQLCQFLSKINLFENLGSQSLNQLARSLTKQSYEPGQYIIRQGEIGEKFYVIFKGIVRCTRTGDNGTEAELVKLHAGDVFGERALIKKEPRAANVIANTLVECYFLDRDNFNLMLGGLIDRMNQMNELRILRGATVFKGFTDKRLKILRKLLNKYTLMKNQVLLCDGSNSIYIILEGTLENPRGQVYSVGDCTGVLDLVNETIICDGDLITKSEEAVVMSIHKQTLLEHLQSQERDINLSNSGGGMGEGGGDGGGGDPALGGGNRRGSIDITNMEMKRDSIILKNISTMSRLKPPKNQLYLRSQPTDFTFHELLGKGTFGNVYRVSSQVTSSQIAFKCLVKEILVKSGQHLYVKREAIALQHFHSPFIVEYYGLLMTPLRVIFLLEYLPGIELWTYLYHYKGAIRGPYGGLDMISVATISGSILLALEHIHSHGYAYRDLKPENIIIGKDGFIKVVDFGFAKPVPFLNKSHELQYRTFTLCGTPDYMAPEIVLTQGHDGAADLWAYGVVLYELMCGTTPFSGRNQQRTFEKIVHSQKHLQFPQVFDSHGKSLIRRLLHPNASLRIGCLQNGFKDIKDHAFFLTQNIDFQKLLLKDIVISFIPSTSGSGNGTGEGGLAESLDSGERDFDIAAEMRLPWNDEVEGYFEGLCNSCMTADED